MLFGVLLAALILKEAQRRDVERGCGQQLARGDAAHGAGARVEFHGLRGGERLRAARRAIGSEASALP